MIACVRAGLIAALFVAENLRLAAVRKVFAAGRDSLAAVGRLARRLGRTTPPGIGVYTHGYHR